MALKDWLHNVTSLSRKTDGKGRGKGGHRRNQALSAADLIALERYDDALEFLRDRLKRNPKDHHARLNLADLMFKLGQRVDAVDEYMLVAEGYASDGFADKEHALLTKLSRLMPTEEKLKMRIARRDQTRELKRRRDLAFNALIQEHGGKAGTVSFKLQQAVSGLEKCSLMMSLSPDQIQRLFAEVEILELGVDSKLAAKDERRDELFIVLQGEIAAQIELKTGARTALRVFPTGSVIGESALLRRTPWPTDYVAVSKTALAQLNREGLEKLLSGEQDPRGLLDSLREQNHDGEVVAALSGLSTSDE